MSKSSKKKKILPCVIGCAPFQAGRDRKKGLETMKKTLAILAAISLFGGIVGVSAEGAKAEILNESVPYTLHTEGKAGRQIDVVLMVPLRDVAEQLGFKVTWEKDKTLVDNGTFHTYVTVGKDLYVISHKEQQETKAPIISLGIPPALRGSVTYVPVSLFQHLLGDHTGTVTVNGETITIGAPRDAGDTAETVKPEETPTEAANPFQDYDTLAKAEQDAGFTLSLPDTKNDTKTSYRAIKGKLLEVITENEGGEALRIRKGTDAGDVSGDYTSYPTIKTINVDGINVRMKGRGNRMNLATWSDGGYSYSLHTVDAATIAEMMDYVRAVK